MPFYRVLDSFVLAPGRYACPGEVIELSEAKGLAWTHSHLVTPAPDHVPPPTDAAPAEPAVTAPAATSEPSSTSSASSAGSGEEARADGARTEEAPAHPEAGDPSKVVTRDPQPATQDPTRKPAQEPKKGTKS